MTEAHRGSIKNSISLSNSSYSNWKLDLVIEIVLASARGRFRKTGGNFKVRRFREASGEKEVDRRASNESIGGQVNLGSLNRVQKWVQTDDSPGRRTGPGKNKQTRLHIVKVQFARTCWLHNTREALDRTRGIALATLNAAKLYRPFLALYRPVSKDNWTLERLGDTAGQFRWKRKLKGRYTWAKASLVGFLKSSSFFSKRTWKLRL